MGFLGPSRASGPMCITSAVPDSELLELLQSVTGADFTWPPDCAVSIGFKVWLWFAAACLPARVGDEEWVRHTSVADWIGGLCPKSVTLKELFLFAYLAK